MRGEDGQQYGRVNKQLSSTRKSETTPFPCLLCLNGNGIKVSCYYEQVKLQNIIRVCR